jgi:hypothetical protein
LGVDSTLDHHNSQRSDDDASKAEDLLDNDDFKDFDPNSEEKLFGMELFDELPLSERRERFEETVSFTKLKSRVGGGAAGITRMPERLKKKIIKKIEHHHS